MPHGGSGVLHLGKSRMTVGFLVDRHPEILSEASVRDSLCPGFGPRPSRVMDFP